MSAIAGTFDEIERTADQAYAHALGEEQRSNSSAAAGA